MGCAGKPTVRINNLIEEQQMRSIRIFGALCKNVSELSVSKQCPESSEPHQKDENIKGESDSCGLLTYWHFSGSIQKTPANHHKHLKIFHFFG